MNRIIAVLVTMLLLCAICVMPASAATKPNILMICIDDLKPTLGCYGDPIAQTPNIDKLASRGVLFEHAYCNQAVCAPSRNALMTGLRSQTIGIYDLGTNFRKGVPDAVTLGQFLQSHGYYAEGLSKIFHRGHGNHDDAATWSVPHWNPKAQSYQLPASTEKPKVDRDGKKRYAPTERADVDDDAYADGQTAIEAVERLKAARKRTDQPFFLAVGFLRPHLPFNAPEKYWRLYDQVELPLPELKEPPKGAPEFAPTTWGELRKYSDIPATGPLDDAMTRQLIHGYYAATSYTDAQIGRVLDALDKTGLSKNTIVVLWGDHGWHLGDHGMWCKHTNYEQAARIPLVFALPPSMNGPAGVKSKALIESVDVYPTLAALAKLPAPKGLDGVNQADVVKKPTSTVREYATHVYPRTGLLGRAVRTDRYRLVQWKEIGGPEADAVYELYDYQADPLEKVNHIDELPQVAAQLKQILATHPEALPQVGRKPQKQRASLSDKEKQKREGIFKKRDSNKDGQLTLEEFLQNQPDGDAAKTRFPKFDRDGNGTLSEDEYVYSGRKP